MGQQRLQELKEKYGQGRVILIQVDVRSYQQFEGEGNLLWRTKKRHDKYIDDNNLHIVDTISLLTPYFVAASIMCEILSIRLNDVSIIKRLNFERIHILKTNKATKVK